MHKSTNGWFARCVSRGAIGVAAIVVGVPAVIGVGLGACAQAPCQMQWSDQFPGATDGTIDAMIEFDDGSGGALIVGGGFTHILGKPAMSIARRRANGDWESMGNGIAANDLVRAFAVFDAGDGPAVYAAGWFEARQASVLKWDGSQWITIGAPPGDGGSLAVFDDGSGPALYASGYFPSETTNAPPRGITRWDGITWSFLPVEIGPNVSRMQVFDDGNGPLLYVGGNFNDPASVIPPFLATWDGVRWGGIGLEVNGPVRCFGVSREEGDAALFVGGEFTAVQNISASRIAKWDGQDWHALGSGLQQTPECIAVTSNSGTTALVAGGRQLLGADSSVAEWNGTSWHSLSASAPGINSTTGSVRQMRFINARAGVKLVVTGNFSSRFAELMDAEWTMLGRGLAPTMAPGVPFGLKVVEHPLDGRPVLCAFGGFGSAGSANAATIALWDGSAWEALGSGVATVGTSPLQLWMGDVCSVEDELGRGLIAGGTFNRAGGEPVQNIARWDGKSWAAMGDGFGKVWNLATFDDGSGTAVFVGGSRFSQAAGGVVCFHKWQNGAWVDIPGPLSSDARALCKLTDDAGEALFGAALEQIAPQQYVTTVHRWDGETFQQIGGQFSRSGGTPRINSLAMLPANGASPSRLIAAGDFTHVDQLPISHVAQWNGAAWTPLDQGLNGTVASVVVLDDGHGPALYAAGSFSLAGDVVVNSVAKWDGSSWSGLGDAFNGGGNGASSRTVYEIAAFDDGTGGTPSLFAIGKFTEVDGKCSSQIARWGRFAPPQPGDADGDCMVNFTDLFAILSTWGLSGGAGDVNHDGLVNVTDLLLVISNWGATSTG